MRKSIVTLALGGALAVGLSTATMAAPSDYVYTPPTYTYYGGYYGQYPQQTYYGYPGYYSNPVAGAANVAGNVVGGALNAAGSIVGGTLDAAGNVARGITTPYPYYGSSYPNYYGSSYPNYTYRSYTYRGESPSYSYWGYP
ncbi:MAG TPA: hypothetical protein VFX06_08190 [Stellaceae bacterium]|nr:hypothetical protein [Stellaceae bacterium]